MSIDHTIPVPLYLQVYEDIKKKIQTGSLLPGTQIESQEILAKQYNVSLITIKRALADLGKESYIYSRVGKGTFVNQQSRNQQFAMSGTLGLVLTDFNNLFFTKIFQSIESSAREYGYQLLFSYSSNNAEKEENQIKYFQEMGVKGLLVASTEHTNRASSVIRELHNQHFPYVMVSYVEEDDIFYVGTDHARGAYLATQQLIQFGCRKIGYINAAKGNPLGELRRRGFLQSLDEYGLPYHPEWEFQFPTSRQDYQSGFSIGQMFTQLDMHPDGIFSFNDHSALGFEHAVLAEGYSIPEDIALVGFDDVQFDAPAPVPLTTVHQPTEDIGQSALEKLVHQIEGKPVEKRTIFQPRLIIRESCGSRITVQ